ncbi:hypothetical protein AGABI1DRAFT_40653 [Agaricus bisporus var. burnettii JB137-S8]|uniref:Cyclopropane-fatty-acyl-phospholipid synthase n=1 Tax=Agaricus bisporus var. burnettii (strain JB137-S8 / ATCC MYA-4627 / FGSC 10392) TaxID=597362 RepID=K5X820_AGABU|nr:uncharacterized protein AGABI1DRAFT_40653 [Agaricus bisporus var. burnettii JB137-S8]EKM79097.1 hypothetical protein AGABI1DRAFT_40653 [Agaricus bisporus var. burnettii JB137-S8]
MSSQILDIPSKHRFSISGFLDQTWNSVAESVMQAGWAPLTSLAEKAVVSSMQRITLGQLKVVTLERIYTFPEPSPSGEDEFDARPEVKAEIRVLKDTFWVRLCAMGGLGFAESYMYGEVECDDLISLFQIFIDNKDNLDNMESRVPFLFSLPQKLRSYRFLNTIGNSRSNISAHYDISNDMFAGFLSSDMTYSCAIFKDLDGDLKQDKRDDLRCLELLRDANAEVFNGYNVQSDGRVHRNGDMNGLTNGKPINISINGHGNNLANGYPQVNNHAFADQNHPGSLEDDELYEAQMRKLDHIINKAKIQPGQRVLEIGSGWGSMAIRITQRIPGTTVDTITLSVQQQILAEKRISAVGLSDRITVHLMDYRNMPPEWNGAFDRVVSIEMVEAVGEEFLETYWRTVEWALNPLTGAGVVQVITIPETRWDRYRNEIDFIQKWVIFPGGILPTLTLLLDTLRSGSKNRLIVDSVSNIGPHYARTLREWRRRFLDQFEDIIVPALQEDYPSVMGPLSGERGRQEIEVFRRKWIYYYCYCEIGFTTRTIGDHIITFAREGYQDFGCEVFV